MKPEIILQSNLLDIVFDNRNKAYGAYDLRKQYNSRLTKALSITAAVVAIFMLYSFINFNKQPAGQLLNPIYVDSVELTDLYKKEPEKEKELQKKYDEPVRERAYTEPLIVDEQLADKDVPEMEDLEKAIISTDDKDGVDAGPNEILPQGKEDVFVARQDPPEPEVEPVSAPLHTADVMPEFPGGHEAFMRFMLRNLRQPDNLDEGQKIVVRVQFVVDAEGSISNVVVLQSGGELDKEVLRVVNKMPRWKPGQQAGKAVPVYFQVPVTFVAGEQ